MTSGARKVKNMPDTVELAQDLVRFSTVLGENERTALEYLAGPLEDAGFACSFDVYDENRPQSASLIARLHPEDEAPSLYLGGHIDTVPFGNAAWRHDPLGGVIEDGRLYGRGACDMKGGVAALVRAALDFSLENNASSRKRDLVLHIYGGEEGGCFGSRVAARRVELFGKPGAGIVAEPSALMPLSGHKGALWLTLRTTGRTAHASMPDKGDNALLSMLRVAARLADFHPDASHKLLGNATAALTSLHSGLNSNSIPDKAELTLDMRTVPGVDHAGLARRVAETTGADAHIEVVYDAPAVWTDPDLPWSVRVRELTCAITGDTPEVRCANFFTDAASVRTVFPDLPLCILGPGDPALAHVTDEFCPVEQIRAARRIYVALIADWYAGRG
ncbi:MAG: M20 family metallopeptidase [Desulfovibrio sp.]|jgi:succinyl-diaminopimelate desuccinylase|nr:M20 family metallopeptidase [Desulfovibrio sp.]